MPPGEAPSVLYDLAATAAATAAFGGAPFPAEFEWQPVRVDVIPFAQLDEEQQKDFAGAHESYRAAQPLCFKLRVLRDGEAPQAWALAAVEHPAWCDGAWKERFRSVLTRRRVAEPPAEA